MYFYQDHYIWSDGDRATEFVFRMDSPQIERRDGTHLLPESPALFRLPPHTSYFILFDFEIRIAAEGMIWRQHYADEGWSKWHDVRYDEKVFREPAIVTPLVKTAWNRLLEDDL